MQQLSDNHFPDVVVHSRRARGLPAAVPIPVRLEGDPVLVRAVEPVGAIDDQVIDVIASLHATLAAFREASGFGRGIAAPQIGISLSIVALQLGAVPFSLINPVLTHRSDDTFKVWDDCLSVPDRICRVSRHCSVDVQYRNDTGQQCHWRELPMDLSELVQHELDHLDGILMTDRVTGPDDIKPMAERAELIDAHRKTQKTTP